LIHGARSSLSVAVVAQVISLVIGVVVGMLTGCYKGWIDQALVGIMNVLDCFPWLLLVLVIVGLFGSQNNMIVIMLVLGATGWTPLARLVRGEALKLSGQPFIQAAQALGATNRRIIFRHLLPNTLGLILVNSTFGVASIILAESSLDFLGFGLQAPTPSWGDTLASGEGFLDIAWWLTLFPGLIMFLSIMGYNFVGEGLREALDPHAQN
jgi:peptide/nickel transport system permease protein